MKAAASGSIETALERRAFLLGVSAAAAFPAAAFGAPLQSTRPPPIVIGFVDEPGPAGSVRTGVELAIAQINAKGGPLGRPFSLVPVSVEGGADEASQRAAAVSAARQLTGHADLVAVIGHATVSAAIAASITYEQAGVLYLNALVTDDTLTQHGFQMVFTTIESDGEIAAHMATFAFTEGLRRVVILRSRQPEAERLGASFSVEAARLGMSIVAERAFAARETNFRNVIADLASKQFNAAFIAADDAQAVALAEQMYQRNARVPLLLGKHIDADGFRSALGSNPLPVLAPVRLSPADTREGVAAFRAAYRARYDRSPDGWSLEGYEAANLLAALIVRCRGSNPLALASELRFSFAWKGAKGLYSFARNGALYTRAPVVVKLAEGAATYYLPDS
ncbi:amino acid/amide ABC transporter substrate-binding protein (HAAT family) [Roseiarcus fermentans]|uniref:Amino acid/amide ABC transporter substrate-binding protein (HAAT family) n=1 Tax=Roseiarcus fermentans TaxID=1473586 RepID=A0A366FRS0_9HYPH|nr:ABC transporter substrate-binding protein [Roseiarcus fermentans]RBP17257.1 amino acid/amide ABC transporter substrate-binding protein (HAAT family) [Roseiarcus fermentans]